MSKIFMYWFKMPNNQINFGDEVGPFLVSKISGYDLEFIEPNRKYLIKKLFNSILKNNNCKKDFFKILIKKKRVLITVGSILGHYNIKNCNIWGSGIIKKDEKVFNANFFALRGKYTQDRLNELGYQTPEVFGDPALLLPLVVPNNSKKKYRLGVIPHYVHYEETLKIFDSNEVLIINLLDAVENVVNKINMCETTISSSLHGIIVSHAYKIPCLWYNLSDKPLYGDNIKFLDYFSSVGINNYKPFKLPKIDNKNGFVQSITNKVNSKSEINSIQFDLKEIQKKLIDAAPFPVKEEYLNI